MVGGRRARAASIATIQRSGFWKNISKRKRSASARNQRQRKAASAFAAHGISGEKAKAKSGISENGVTK